MSTSYMYARRCFEFRTKVWLARLIGVSLIFEKNSVEHEMGDENLSIFLDEPTIQIGFGSALRLWH